MAEIQRMLRADDIIAPNGPLPICRSNWWKGVKEGRYPKPVKLGPKTTVWYADDIAALVTGLRETGGAK